MTACARVWLTGMAVASATLACDTGTMGTIGCGAEYVNCEDGCCRVCNVDRDCDVGDECCGGKCRADCPDCVAPQEYCTEVDECRNLSTDFVNCGACGHSCLDDLGTAVDACAGGRCICAGLNRACASGLACCSGACEDTSSSFDHCGDCGRDCDPNQICVLGDCVDDDPNACAPLTRCETVEGPQCADLSQSLTHCGTCENDCDAVFGARIDTCSSGVCACFAAGTGAPCAAGDRCTGGGCVPDLQGCELPWGGSLVSGQSVTAFAASNVACHQTCASETRTCTNGVLSGSYSAQSCTVDSCGACSLPWGGSIADGQSVTAHQAQSVACGGSCVSETRVCSNGTLSGTYAFGSCAVDACPCELPWGGSLAHGQNVTAYQTASVACDQSCASQSRACNDGTLSGSYTFAGCAPTCAACTLPWGGSIAHGQSVTAYQAASVACGQSCTSESRTCNNGTLSGGYTSQSCAVAPCPCTLPWGGTIASGQSVTAYETASVPCGTSCNGQTRTCTNGTLSGSFTVQSCAPVNCPCNLPWGGTVAHGTSVTGWSSSVANYPNTCQSSTRVCNNGSLPLGAYTYASCSQECATYTGDDVVCNLGYISVIGEWVYHEGWCVTPACYQNLWGRGSPLSSQTCYDDHDDGSCEDPDDLWTVTCSPYYVNGTWNCDGATCSPTYYDATCTGHW